MQRQPTWLGNSSGLFTVSSAYSLQISQAFPDTSRVWDLFWKMKGPLRLNILLWQIYNGYVPAAHFLFYRHVVSAPCCCIRDNTIEDTLHAFWDCPWVCTLWRHLLCPSIWVSFFRPSDDRAWLMNIRVWSGGIFFGRLYMLFGIGTIKWPMEASFDVLLLYVCVGIFYVGQNLCSARRIKMVAVDIRWNY